MISRQASPTDSLYPMAMAAASLYVGATGQLRGSPQAPLFESVRKPALAAPNGSGKWSEGFVPAYCGGQISG